MEQQAFIEAVRANPADRTARLVYADWLDERDDPLGSYIRAECAAEDATPGSPEMTDALNGMLAAVQKAGGTLGGWEYEPTLDRIRQRLDRVREVFRESGDDIPDPELVPEAELLAFELRHGVMLPGEYRALALRIGEGDYGYCWYDFGRPADLPELRIPFPHSREVCELLRYKSLREAGFDAEPPSGIDLNEAPPEQSTNGCLNIGSANGYGAVLLGVNGGIRGQVWTDGDHYGPCIIEGGQSPGFLNWLERGLVV